MKNETKILIVVSALLLLSLICNGYFLGNSGGTSEQIRLYEELNRKSNITEGLLTDGIESAKKDLSTARVISDKLREDNRALKATNERRKQLDTVAESLSGRTRVTIVEGITRIDTGSGRLGELQRVEQEERQALEGLLGSE